MTLSDDFRYADAVTKARGKPKDRVRNVATPAGAKKYNAPIGTPITAARVATKTVEGVRAVSDVQQVGRKGKLKGTRRGRTASLTFKRSELKGFTDESLAALPGRLLKRMPKSATLKERQAMQEVLDMISDELFQRTGVERSWTVTHKGALERPAIVNKVSSRVYPDLERSPGDDDNWVERSGGLPSYIERIAKHLHYERGFPIGRAIATAVSRCRRWARGGGGVNPDTRAKAAKAIAEWEAKKVKSRAKTAARTARTANKRRRRDVGKSEPHEIAECEIIKTDSDRQCVFGWAYVSHDTDGEVNVDKSGEFVSDPDELESAAYNFVLKSRNGDLNHDNVVKSTMVESIVFTDDKLEALGIEKGTVPTGWWVGFRVGDDKTWADVKAGKYKAFSIHGIGSRKAVS